MSATPFVFRNPRDIPPRGYEVPLDALDGDVLPGFYKDDWRLPIIDATKWIGRQPPPRHFIVDQWLASGSACMFIAEDGVGKSLLGQQLATCRATGKPFLGLAVEQGPALYLTVEDDEDELWRRQRSTNLTLGVPTDAGPVRLSSLRGLINVALGIFDGDGNFIPGPFYEAIAEACRAFPGTLVVLDNVAHLFPGNENVRREVAAFCSALDSLAINNDATVVMIGHPSKGGAEYSGSTGWSAHVRQRWFMERPEGADRDARVLRKSKANYAESGTEIAFRWHDWAFVRDEDLPADTRAEIAETVRASHDNEVFLSCLRERNRREQAVSENPASRTYAPHVFASMPEAKAIGKARLEAAMDRLYRIDAIERGYLWRADRKDKFGLREKCADPRADPALTPCADPVLTTRRPALTHTPYINISGRGLEAPQPDIDEDDWDSRFGPLPDVAPDDVDWDNQHGGDA